MKTLIRKAIGWTIFFLFFVGIVWATLTYSTDESKTTMIKVFGLFFGLLIFIKALFLINSKK